MSFMFWFYVWIGKLILFLVFRKRIVRLFKRFFRPRMKVVKKNHPPLLGMMEDSDNHDSDYPIGI